MSTDRNRTRRILLGAVTAGLLLVGCGDDDGGQEAAPAITSSTPTSAASTSADGDAVEVGDGGGGGDFCQLNEEIARLFGELARNGNEETWAHIEGVVAQMPDAAPPELAADVAAAMGYYPMARAELEAANWDVGVLDSLALEPDHAAAEENITAYLDANC